LVIFIANPTAGAGKAGAAIPIVEKKMQSLGINHAIINTGGPGDIEKVAAKVEQATEGAAPSAIVCVGGDGTVQEYAGLALKYGSPYGVIPCGTANDLLYSLPGTGMRFNSFEEKINFYASKLSDMPVTSIDAVSINGSCYFLNIGGTGMDINVLIDALPLKKYFSGGAYFISMIKNAVTYKDEEMTLTIDGKAESGTYLLLAICNGAYYGGHLKVAPPAVPNDGLLTMCVIKKMPRIKRVAVFPLVKPGLHSKLKEVSYINCESVILEYEGKKTINLDGNLQEFESPLKFEVMKGAIKFIN